MQGAGHFLPRTLSNTQWHSCERTYTADPKQSRTFLGHRRLCKNKDIMYFLYKYLYDVTSFVNVWLDFLQALICYKTFWIQFMYGYAINSTFVLSTFCFLITYITETWYNSSHLWNPENGFSNTIHLSVTDLKLNKWLQLFLFLFISQSTKKRKVIIRVIGWLQAKREQFLRSVCEKGSDFKSIPGKRAHWFQ